MYVSYVYTTPLIRSLKKKPQHFQAPFLWQAILTFIP